MPRSKQPNPQRRRKTAARDVERRDTAESDVTVSEMRTDTAPMRENDRRRMEDEIAELERPDREMQFLAHQRPRIRGGRHRGDGETLASGLGWFSLALGIAQIAAPGSLAHLIGVRNTARSRALMRVIGVREVAAGVGILSQSRTSDWAWARVAGDVMDLTLLGSALTADDARRGRTAAATAAVLGVAALDVLAGQELERDSATGTATRRPGARGIRVMKSITVNRPPQDVYDFWRHFENLPRFMRHLESVESLGDGRSRWRAKAPAGTTVEWEAVITDDRPNELIAWRSVEGSDVWNTGVRFRPAPGGRGTEVHVNIRYDPPGGVVTSALTKLFREEPGQQVRDDLRTFKQVMETGEVVRADATLERGPHPARPPADLPPDAEEVAP
jgi:uncharacterized membrane protein